MDNMVTGDRKIVQFPRLVSKWNSSPLKKKNLEDECFISFHAPKTYQVDSKNPCTNWKSIEVHLDVEYFPYSPFKLYLAIS